MGTIYENSSNREAPNKQERGSRKYKKMVSEDTARSDKYGNLPFKFVKPPKRTQARRDIIHRCDHCGNLKHVNKNTAGIQCSGCRKYSSVNISNSFTEEAFLELLELEAEV